MRYQEGFPFLNGVCQHTSILPPDMQRAGRQGKRGSSAWCCWLVVRQRGSRQKGKAGNISCGRRRGTCAQLLLSVVRAHPPAAGCATGCRRMGANGRTGGRATEGDRGRKMEARGPSGCQSDGCILFIPPFSFIFLELTTSGLVCQSHSFYFLIGSLVARVRKTEELLKT
jgi:hypothetical protein